MFFRGRSELYLPETIIDEEDICWEDHSIVFCELYTVPVLLNFLC